MELKGQVKGMHNNIFTGELEVVLSTKDKSIANNIEALKGDLRIKLVRWREKRSLDANAYLWSICQKVAEKIQSTKEEVYIKTIKEVGQFEIVPIKIERASYWINNWKAKGLGWHSEIMHESKLQGYTNTINYYGTSVYDTKEMSLVIDSIVEEAKELGIETLPPEELERIKEQWGIDIKPQ